MNKAIIAIAGAGLLVSACATDQYGNSTGPNETVRQGAIGAGIGAVAGAIIGNNVGDGNAGRGAAIGAVVGGVAGAVRGSQQDRARHRRHFVQHPDRRSDQAIGAFLLHAGDAGEELVGEPAGRRQERARHHA